MKPALKSRLFSKFDPANKDNDLFGKHLRLALSLSSEQMAACIGKLVEFRLARVDAEVTRVLDSLEEETHLPQTEVEQVLSVLLFFLNRLLKDDYKNDTPEQWAEDLVTLDQMEKKSSPFFISSATRIRDEVVPKVELVVRRRVYSEGVLPGFRTCGTTVEMRAVQKDRYRWGHPVEDYESEVVDIAGVVSVNIGLDQGTPRDFSFQMSEDALADLISQLNAARKDLLALNEFISKR